jgi:hypothetical protein
VFISTPTAGWLTSLHRSLYKPACAYAKASATRVPLAYLPGTTPVLTELSPFGTLIFMRYIHHSRHTQHLQEIGGSMVKSSFVLRIKVCGGRNFSSSKSPTTCSCKTLGTRQTNRNSAKSIQYSAI